MPKSPRGKVLKQLGWDQRGSPRISISNFWFKSGQGGAKIRVLDRKMLHGIIKLLHLLTNTKSQRQTDLRWALLVTSTSVRPSLHPWKAKSKGMHYVLLFCFVSLSFVYLDAFSLLSFWQISQTYTKVSKCVCLTCKHVSHLWKSM